MMDLVVEIYLREFRRVRPSDAPPIISGKRESGYFLHREEYGRVGPLTAEQLSQATGLLIDRAGAK